MTNPIKKAAAANPRPEPQATSQVQTQYGLRTSGSKPAVRMTWPVYLLVGAGTTLVAAIALPMFIAVPTLGVGVVGAALTALAVIGQMQAEGRATITAEAKLAMERVTGPLPMFRPRRWRGGFVGIPETILLKYHPGAVVTDGTWPAPAAAAASQIFGERYRVAKINRRSGRMKLCRDRSELPTEQRQEPEVERAGDLITQIFGASARSKIGLNDAQQLARIEVRHDQKLKASVNAWRERVDRVVTSMLPGRWRSFWDLENDTVVFELRPKFPKTIIREPSSAKDREGKAFYKIKLGRDEDGNEMSWNLMSTMPHLLIVGKTGKGKSLAITTPIATPKGWTTIGAVKVGDHVFDDTGKPTRVLGVYDQPPNRPCYEITFSDGSTIVADEEHRWWTETRRANRVARSLDKVAPPRQRRPDEGDRLVHDQCHKVNRGDVRTTAEIRDTLRAQDGSLNHSIPTAGALRLPEVELSIAPYTLGCWLADGDSSGCGLTSADPEVVELIRIDGYQVKPHEVRLGACPRYGIWGIRGKLNELRILRTKADWSVTKRVPGHYLRSSIQQRRALLAGLLDTDGTVSPQGRIQYTSIIEGLAEDVRELAISLGYRTTIKVGMTKFDGREYGPAWTVSFTTADPVFRLTRKLLAQRERTVRHMPERTLSRYIVDVRPVESRPVRCIEVDSPSHLYLAGRSMIPTHNTNVIRGVVVDCASRGIRVWCGDPKRVELSGFIGWPNVQIVTTSIETIVAMILHAWHLMEDRYEKIETGQVRRSDLELLVLLVDEYAELTSRINAWWSTANRDR